MKRVSRGAVEREGWLREYGREDRGQGRRGGKGRGAGSLAMSLGFSQATVKLPVACVLSVCKGTSSRPHAGKGKSSKTW